MNAFENLLFNQVPDYDRQIMQEVQPSECSWVNCMVNGYKPSFGIIQFHSPYHHEMNIAPMRWKWEKEDQVWRDRPIERKNVGSGKLFPFLPERLT